MPRPRRARFTEADPTEALVREVRSLSLPLYGWEDLDPLMERIGDSRRDRALHPLYVPGSFEHELPETFPTGV